MIDKTRCDINTVTETECRLIDDMLTCSVNSGWSKEHRMHLSSYNGVFSIDLKCLSRYVIVGGAQPVHAAQMRVKLRSTKAGHYS